MCPTFLRKSSNEVVHPDTNLLFLIKILSLMIVPCLHSGPDFAYCPEYCGHAVWDPLDGGFPVQRSASRALQWMDSGKILSAHSPNCCVPVNGNLQ